MGWIGSYAKWIKILDLIIALQPKAVVPGHGPVCGVEGVVEMKAYLEYLRRESRRCFDRGLTSLEASKQIDLGPYGAWRAPARVYLNVERAYREFRNEPEDKPWNSAKAGHAAVPAWSRPPRSARRSSARSRPPGLLRRRGTVVATP
jgi:glyoxylase-like metal-dependent hydrolase (beta-lactamase superfamily II)